MAVGIAIGFDGSEEVFAAATAPTVCGGA